MIKVNRLECPNILKAGVVPESEGERESKDAIRFFSKIANRYTPFKKTGLKGTQLKESFTVYKHKFVRKQLRKMFHGKCAYCESRITSIYAGDVEHFRPKGGYSIDKLLTKPGYYWLASDWENLLFACPFCNQTNTHKILENGTLIEVIQGKLNQFPLVSEKNRLNCTHGNMYFNDSINYKKAFELEENDRLLLKPCSDTDLERYFEYNEIGLILAANGLSNTEKDKANVSISVYALQRIGLVQSRAEKIIQIKAQIRRVEEALINFNENFGGPIERVTWFEGILRRELKVLNQFKESNKEYAGLARCIIEQYMKNLS